MAHWPLVKVNWGPADGNWHCNTWSFIAITAQMEVADLARVQPLRKGSVLDHLIKTSM